MNKFTEDDLKKELETKEYEYGFYTDIEADKFPVGLNEEVVIAISKKKNEPEWMTEWRLEAFRIWKACSSTPLPSTNQSLIGTQRRSLIWEGCLMVQLRLTSH